MNNIKFELISFRLHLHNFMSIFSQQCHSPYAPFFHENSRFKEDSRKRQFHFQIVIFLHFIVLIKNELQGTQLETDRNRGKLCILRRIVTQ